MNTVTATLNRGSDPASPLEVPIRRRLDKVRPDRALAIPFIFTASLASMVLLPSVQANVRLARSFWGAAVVLAVWNAALFVVVLTRRRTLILEIVLRKQHYLQACAQGSVLLYWGWYWRQVYDSAYLILAQLLFAYAFDMLLSWSRRDTYTLGFGAFPVIFSINLFLWFKPDWFYLQFLMVAVGFAAKELIRWEKDGRRTHIFNPSSFPLGLFSLVLIVTRTTGISWGPEIAQTFDIPPYIALWIFVIGLPGQYLFGVTTMTMSAVVSLFTFGVAYLWIFGTYFFVDGYISAAVFLGMHLLFTDPSTAPRTELGRIIFGVMYAAGIAIVFAIFDHFGAPLFYDKLMAVPILNLSIQLIDRVARSDALKRFDPAQLGRGMAPKRRHLVYMAIWAGAFSIVLANDGVGVMADAHRVTFWMEACSAQRRQACDVLTKIESAQCRQGSGWACNDLGIRLAQVGGTSDGMTASTAFVRACVSGFSSGCENSRSGMSSATSSFKTMPPSIQDYRILLEDGKGPIPDKTNLQIYDRACKQGWPDGCSHRGHQQLQARDVKGGVESLSRACDLNMATACADLGAMFERGDPVLPDPARAATFLARACALGVASACRR